MHIKFHSKMIKYKDDFCGMFSSYQIYKIYDFKLFKWVPNHCCKTDDDNVVRSNFYSCSWVSYNKGPLIPEATFLLVKNFTYFIGFVEALLDHYASKFISCSLHNLRSLPSLKLHLRTEFWSCAADRGPSFTISYWPFLLFSFHQTLN